jgi:hypothetical protein
MRIFYPRYADPHRRLRLTDPLLECWLGERGPI